MWRLAIQIRPRPLLDRDRVVLGHVPPVGDELSFAHLPVFASTNEAGGWNSAGSTVGGAVGRDAGRGHVAVDARDPPGHRRGRGMMVATRFVMVSWLAVSLSEATFVAAAWPGIGVS